MSDKNPFDEEIKTKMATYEVQPPEEVWLNINKQRSYGHITTNRIMQAFLMTGILALVVGFGMYFSAWSKPVEAKYSSKPQQPISWKSALPERPQFTTEVEEKQKDTKLAGNNAMDVQVLPTQDLTASIGASSLYLDPSLFADQSLQRLLTHVEDISLIEAFELVRYERLSKVSPQPPVFEKLQAQLEKKDEWTYFPEFKKRNQFAIALTFTPEFIKKDFELRNFLPQGYADNRKDYVRSRKAYTVSARTVFRWGKHSFAESGIDYTSISESTQVSESVYSSGFSFYSFPLLFGQEVQFNRISWRVKTGFSYQFYNDFHGTMLGADGIQTLDLNTSENPYRNSGVFNLHVSTGINYLYRENLRLHLEPYYKRSLNSLSKSDSEFSERIEYMGIAVGLSMDIE